ncbi:MAG: hypothetical protein ABSG08_20575 [Terriglobales bacterium]|jgi:hypothetical protein
MVIVNSFATKNVRRRFLMGQLALLLICGTAYRGSLWAQSAPAKTTSSDNASTRSQDGPSALSFSIESEMLTYRALESNSEAVACDIAAYLNGSSADFTNPPAGEVCTVNASANGKASVVIFPFDRTAFDDFHLWRADMGTMNELRTRAATYCPVSTVMQVTERGSGAAGSAQGSGAAGSALALTPAGSALSLAQSVLGMASSQASTSPVGGTIEDQAFMDGVARELRSLSVPVLMPTAYGPYSLSVMDASRSPFLSSLDKLFQARVCLQDEEAKSDEKASAKSSIGKLIDDMDAYLAMLSGRTAAAAKNAELAQSKQGDGSAVTQASGGTAPTSSPSHLMAVLSADGLAQKLGVDPATGLLPENAAWQHLLLLKALESGGSIQKSANILRTKIRYSGGSVGTYAMFTMDGELECSGNVYDYGGSIPAKTFQQDLRHHNHDPASQYIFQRGSCHTPVKH